MESRIIRPYAPEDWNGISRVHDSARKIELHLAGLDDAFLPLAIAAEREDLFGYTLLTALEGDTVVGFTAFTEEELAWLYVLPEHHRQGIGKALVEAALKVQPEIREIEVLEGNLPARRLYEACGFHVEETVHGVMPGNESFPVTVWCLRR